MTPEQFELANCKGVDPNLFFPERGESQRAAKAICNICLIQEECLEENIAVIDGIYGGLNRRERRRLRVARSRLYIMPDLPGIPSDLEPERPDDE